MTATRTPAFVPDRARPGPGRRNGNGPGVYPACAPDSGARQQPCLLTWWKQDRLLMTGDHMMGGSTVVIVPPAGNMKDYIASLERMLNYDLEFVVAPGHGDLIGRARRRRFDTSLPTGSKPRATRYSTLSPTCGPCDIRTTGTGPSTTTSTRSCTSGQRCHCTPTCSSSKPTAGRRSTASYGGCLSEPEPAALPPAFNRERDLLRRSPSFRFAPRRCRRWSRPPRL